MWSVNMENENSVLDIARHLDLSEKATYDIFKKLDIDYKTTSLDVIRISYIKMLREQAAGRGGDHQVNAAIARARKDNNAAQLIELQIQEKTGTLIPVSKVEPFITSLIIAARQQLINLPRKWSQELQAIHNLDVDEQYFLMDVNDALNQLSNADVFSDVDNDASSDESLGSPREIAHFTMVD